MLSPFRRRGRLVFALASFTLCAAAHASPVPVPDLPDLVEKTLPGVVNVSSTAVTNYTVFGMDDFLNMWGVPQERKTTSLGSGFIIDKDGYVLTNNHVVEKATEVLVTLLDKRVLKAKIIGKDEKLDIALLQIRDKNHQVPADLTPVPLADSDAVRIGESVFAVGNPFGLQHTVTLGIISAKHRTVGVGPFDNFLQTDASINPGNSGGPLFNLKGAVVGINTVIYSRTGQSSGLGFATPINEAKRLIPDLKRYGHVPRPWLGVLGDRLTPQLAQYYDLPVSDGVLVYSIANHGPADRASIRQGDIILSVDGADTKETNDVERALAKHRPGDEVELKVIRGSHKRTIRIKLEELPALDEQPRGII